ncbi:hypothetical protein Hanom_Chr17g01589151 [Helianthus anomalus]
MVVMNMIFSPVFFYLLNHQPFLNVVKFQEECQDLKKKVKSGMLQKLELWIPRELGILKHRIDQANEKRWRKEYPFFSN